MINKYVDVKLTVSDVMSWLSQWPQDEVVGAAAMCCDCRREPLIYVGEWVAHMDCKTNQHNGNVLKLTELACKDD